MDASDDPEWCEESMLYEMFRSRIPTTEFIDLFTSDKNWTHFAKKSHFDKILELFDKVYGYTRGLTRLEE